jgi:uncharacterized protein (DUF169 family)
MVTYAEQHGYLVGTLSLPTPPVAVKYLRALDDEAEWGLADSGFYRPKTPLNVCQFVGLARHHLRKSLATADDQACNVGALATGMHPFDEPMRRGEIAQKEGARCTPALCAEMFAAQPRIPFGEVKAIAFSPLDKMDLEADQIIIYGNPLQVLKVLNGYLYSTAPRMAFSTSAKYGVCVEAMAATYLSGKPSLGFPCRGERVSSIVQDHEMFICLPAEDLDRVVEGIEKTRHLLPSPMPFGGVDQEPSFLPDHYLTPGAKRRRG